MSSQISESITLRLFRMGPKLGRWVFVALEFTINGCLSSFCSWSVFERPLKKASVHRCNRQLVAICLLSVIFALLGHLPEGPSTITVPCTERIRVMKNNTGE